MRLIFAAAFVVLTASPSLQPAAPSVDDLVARHIAARGGYDKLKAVQTIRLTRTVASAFSDIHVVISRKRPQLYRVDQSTAGQPASARGVNATDAWDLGPNGKVALRPAPLASETREIDADFDGLLVDWKAKGHMVTFEGRETLPGGDAYKLRVTTKGGVVRYIYLDAATYLDRRHTGVVNLPGNRQYNMVMDFSGWRDVNGIKFPFSIDEDRTGREPSQSFATYTDKIELNAPLDDALFATPSGTVAPGAGGQAQGPRHRAHAFNYLAKD